MHTHKKSHNSKPKVILSSIFPELSSPSPQKQCVPFFHPKATMNHIFQKHLLKRTTCWTTFQCDTTGSVQGQVLKLRPGTQLAQFFLASTLGSFEGQRANARAKIQTRTVILGKRIPSNVFEPHTHKRRFLNYSSRECDGSFWKIQCCEVTHSAKVFE